MFWIFCSFCNYFFVEDLDNASNLAFYHHSLVKSRLTRVSLDLLNNCLPVFCSDRFKVYFHGLKQSE